MKSVPGSLKPPPQYRQLQRRLAQLGYLSQGSVFERRPGQQGSRYVWTRKVKAKTVTVALSPEQYLWLRNAVTNQRQLERLLCAKCNHSPDKSSLPMSQVSFDVNA